MGKGKTIAATGGRAKPREFRSEGAKVARTFTAMPKPVKTGIAVQEGGTSREFNIPKPLRGGERVLSANINRFECLADADAVALLANANANANANAAAGGAAANDA